MRRFARMVQIVDGLRREHPDCEWQFVTLTVENCPEDQLQPTLDEMAHAWDIIMRRKQSRSMFLGWARSLEVTYNAEKRTLHPHYHVLALLQPGYSGDDQYLESAWMTTVDLKTLPQCQDTQRVQSLRQEQPNDTQDEVISAICETYKYSVKSKDLQEMPLKVFRDLDKALKGRRMVAFGGEVKKYAALLDLEKDEPDEDTDEEAEEMIRCADCGSVKVVQIVGQWTGDGYLWRRTARL